LAHALLQEHSDKRLKLAQLLGQLGVFLTSSGSTPPAPGAAGAIANATRTSAITTAVAFACCRRRLAWSET
jgi:hypothetical protein